MSKTKSTAKANFEKTTWEDGMAVALKLHAEIIDFCEVITVAGSIRQGKPMVGDVDIVIVPKPPVEEFIERIKERIEFEYGGTKKLFGMYQGRPINIFITTPDSYGACLYQSTGPALYNVHIRGLAKRKGLKLNEYGLYRVETGEKIAGSSEEEIFTALGKTYAEPENRKAPEWAKK